MQCREFCGACCIVPAINTPFYGMPNGKAVGERCVHLQADARCALFGKPQRPACCAAFQAEPSVCGENLEQAITLLKSLERQTGPNNQK